MRTRGFSASFAWACISLGFAGCIATATPKIVQVYPLQNQPSVDATIRSLSVTYNNALDAQSVETNTLEVFEKNGSNQGPTVAGSTTYNSTFYELTFELNSSASLQPDTTYEAVVSGSLKAGDGQPFSSSYSWTFTTGAAKN
jgi:hypothetical protein